MESYSTLPILAFTETFLQPNDSNVLLPLSNLYNVYRSDRNVRRGGGVCLMVPKKGESGITSLACTKNNFVCTEFETTWCKLICEKATIKLGVIYRRPQHSAEMPKKLIDHIEASLESNIPTIILGDFNYRMINWETKSAPNLAGMKTFLDFMTERGFDQIVNFPTRENAILDLLN